MVTDQIKKVPSNTALQKDKINTYKRWFKDFGWALFTALIVSLLVKWLFFEPFYIPSQSMEPTLTIDDKIIVNKISYGYRDPSRGDIIVFSFPLDPHKKIKYTKRIIGLPGEILSIKNNKVYINGNAINEPYILKNSTYADYGPKEIPKGYYFVLGDNRNNSYDSRKWGLVEKRLIIGKAIFVFWPIKRIGSL